MMKLDADPGNFHPSPPRKSHNPFDSDDETVDSPGLKSTNMQLEESGSDLNLKVFENNSDAIIFHMDNGDFLWEEAMLGQPTTSDQAVNATTANGNTTLFEKERQTYTDKSVTECELPELIVCYKESTIKDIGIDEGAPYNKLWAQSVEDEGKSNGDDVGTEKSNEQLGVLEMPKSTSDCERQKVSGGLDEEALSGQYLVHEFGNNDLLKISELQLDLEEIVTDGADCCLATEKGSDGNTCKGNESDFVVEVGSNRDDLAEKKQNDKSLDSMDDISVVLDSAAAQSPSELLAEHGVKIMPEQIPNIKETSPSPQEHVNALQESDDSSASNKLAYDSKVESRSITFEFDPSTNSELESQEDQSPKEEVAKPPTTQTMTRHEDETSGLNPGKSENRVHGETSFSAGKMPVSPPPSSVLFSEPLAYSGSVSLRSESSAGSTRSFAFPVLQKEWNSSPERMGRARDRHLKKHRSWVQVLSCCKS